MLLRDFFKKIVPTSILIFVIEHKYWFNLRFKGLSNYFMYLYHKMDNDSLSIGRNDIWVNNLAKFCYAQKDRGYQLGYEFFAANIKIIKSVTIDSNDLIMICPQKDDIIRIKKFISYHRSLGVDKFAIIDNDSTDGSLEWLLQQNDVFLFQTKDKYTTIRREAWINRIIAYLGFNRWYAVLDSDEFLTYKDCEKKKIRDLVKHYERSNIKRGQALLLDMYANPEYYENGEIDDFFEECRFFDKDSYKLERGISGTKIQGGPRSRIFGTSSFLIKCPLVFFEKKDLQVSSHYLFPYKKNHGLENQIVIRHYKFLPSDLNKYKERVNSRNFSSGSNEYVKYCNKMQDASKLDFFYEGTNEYLNSASLNSISIYKPIIWE